MEVRTFIPYDFLALLTPGKVLHYIDRFNLLPPLLVIQILARKVSSSSGCGHAPETMFNGDSFQPTATLAIVKDYIVRRLEHENQLISEEQRHVRE